MIDIVDGESIMNDVVVDRDAQNNVKNKRICRWSIEIDCCCRPTHDRTASKVEGRTSDVLLSSLE